MIYPTTKSTTITAPQNIMISLYTIMYSAISRCLKNLFYVSELIITRPPKNATVLQDTRFLMHCETQGHVNPRIKWYHNGEEMVRKGQNYRIGSTGTLRFRNVKVSDRGEYRCKAESGREALFSDPAILVVEGMLVSLFLQSFSSLSFFFSVDAVRFLIWLL